MVESGHAAAASTWLTTCRQSWMNTHSRLVCEFLAEIGAQVFITCVDQRDIVDVWPPDVDLAMFHVEQGVVRPLPGGGGGMLAKQSIERQ